MLCGISKERGLEHYQLFDRSVNVDKFKSYCQNIRAKNGDDQICLFMDNLTSHTSKKSQGEMRRLGLRYIYNVPYAPDYNPIEMVFSQIKQKFRSLRTQKLTGQTNASHEDLIRQAVESVKKKNVQKCVNHVINLLK